MFHNLTELYRYRALVWALVGRHLATRYRGSVLGFVWSFLNPLCLMAVYTVVFKYYMRSNVVEHYSLFLFCGLLPWQWVASSAVEGTNSLVSSGHLITKSMFPAHILPVVSVVTNLVHFLLALPLLVLVSISRYLQYRLLWRFKLYFWLVRLWRVQRLMFITATCNTWSRTC